MATAVQTSTRDRFEVRLNSAFRAHAVELAERAHLTGAARVVEIRERTVLFIVPSANRSKEHVVCADRAGSVWCDCTASSMNHACCHAGSGIYAMRQLAKLAAGYNY